METEEKARDRIVVVHGLGANNGTTWLLSRRLRARGYDVTQFGYPSLFQSIEVWPNASRRDCAASSSRIANGLCIL